jgi:hypothetical protein
MTVIRTGFIYFVAVFAVAFGLGVLRTLVVAPAVGATMAVLLEIPVVLVTSWIVARHLLQGRVLQGRGLGRGECAAMGALAFALLMTAEAALAGVLRGQSAGQWAQELATPLGLIGLAGQIGFAIIPLFAGRERWPPEP